MARPRKDVAGVPALATWATMLVGVILAEAWGVSLPPALHAIALLVWCFGLHLLALWLYRRDLDKWRSRR